MESNRQQPQTGEALFKIVFNLPEKAAPLTTESLWAERIGPNLYRLRNVPFFLHGVSEQDIVRAEETDGQLLASAIVDRGGHSTYRIFLPEQTSEEQFSRDWVPLHELGCTYERASRRLIAIDLPLHADVYAVYEALELGEKGRLWEFEDRHCGHPLRDSPARRSHS
jgi:Domain of unknown function (DUF4265)